jgi:hypothetical protein
MPEQHKLEATLAAGALFYVAFTPSDTSNQSGL